VTVIRKIPWKFVLPAIMLGVTFELVHLDRVWGKGAGRWDDMPVTTAYGPIALLNGPGALFNFFAGVPIRIIMVAVFWCWMGFLLDRRLHGIHTPIIRNIWIRVALWSLGFALSVFAILGFHFYMKSQLWFLSFANLKTLVHIFLNPSPIRKLMGREVRAIAYFLWGVSFAIYFLYKFWRWASAKT
jgi:hypothetical protein